MSGVSVKTSHRGRILFPQRTLMTNALSLLPSEDRRDLVRSYIEQLNDRTLLLICKLYSLGKTDRDVCDALHLTPDTLASLKQTIAEGILAHMQGH